MNATETIRNLSTENFTKINKNGLFLETFKQLQNFYPPFETESYAIANFVQCQRNMTQQMLLESYRLIRFFTSMQLNGLYYESAYENKRRSFLKQMLYFLILGNPSQHELDHMTQLQPSFFDPHTTTRSNDEMFHLLKRLKKLRPEFAYFGNTVEIT